ncbi:hypothetical protein Vafri_875 [Volvox africanus]|nr:hypothetical protein Vafri_875 [Volvox africanus]
MEYSLWTVEPSLRADTAFPPSETATLQAVGSAESQIAAQYTASEFQHAQPPASGPSHAVLPRSQSPFLNGMALAPCRVSSNPLLYQSTNTHGDYLRHRLPAVPEPEITDDRSGRECLVPDALHRALTLQGAPGAVHPTIGQSTECLELGVSDAENSSTPSASRVARPAAETTVVGQLPTPELQVMKPQLLPQMEHKTKTPENPSTGYEGTGRFGHHTASQPPSAALNGIGTAGALSSVAAGQHGAWQPITPGACSQGASQEAGLQQQQQKASYGSGSGGGGSSYSRSWKDGKTNVYHSEMSHDEVESEPDEMDSKMGDEPVLGSSEETDEGAEHTIEARATGDGDCGEDEDKQSEEHMPGCSHCRFTPAGCSNCRTRPLVSRPYARWKPDEARFQEGILDAPVFYPTPEEFADPLSYIAKIRPEAEKYGICRVVPPASCWDPPFTLDSGGSCELFCFEPRRQLTSRLCMRPCSWDNGQGQSRKPGSRQQQQQQQDQRSLACQDHVNSSDRLGQMCMEELGGARSQHTGSRSSQEFVHQHQHQLPQRYRRQEQPQQQRSQQPQQHEDVWQYQQRDLERRPARQEHQQQQEVAAVAPSDAASRMLDSSGVKPAGLISSRRARGAQATIYTRHTGLRLVAPGSSPRPRAPPVVMDESMEQYVAGLRPHPLLGHDEAAAVTEVAATLSAATSSAETYAARVSVGRLQDVNNSADGSKIAFVGQRAQSNGGVAHCCGQHRTSDERSGSDSGNGGELAFESSEQTHTLQSFQAYCRWARSLHFGLPPFGDRYRDKPTGERFGSYPAPSSGQTTTIGEKPVAAAVALAQGTSKAAALAPPVLAAIAHAAEGCEPSVEEVEAEFWRIVERPTEGLVVETLYGSDLDSARHGSGFPLPPWRVPTTDMQAWSSSSSAAAAAAAAPLLDERARQYACHPWNINNLPRARGSMLRYLETNEFITGVMVPWLYFGSCLSAFCWHVEDHALYSITYLHSGAEKVWYGVPGYASEQFTAAMCDAVPHLFHEDPQLLHRVVTHMSPTELRRRGVPVSRLVQEAGSFVITFPNAYHAGLNCGFNCGEAINFAPADWLSFGSAAARTYRAQSKSSTISHDGLLVRLVSAAPAVSAAQQVATLPHVLRPKVEEVEQEEEAPGGLESCVALSEVKTELGPTLPNQEVIVPTANGSGGNGCCIHQPYGWQEGVRLEEVPPSAMCAAVGELMLRLEEEERRRAVARMLGVAQERRMSSFACAKDSAGVHTCTADMDCAKCKCDLFLSAVVSPQCPGVATCPEHAASLGVSPANTILLVRCPLDELRAMIDAALELFPEGHAAIAAARLHLASSSGKGIRRLGPISKYGVPYAVPLDEQDVRDAASEAVCAVAGPLANESYMPYDPGASLGSDSVCAATGEIKRGAAAATALPQALDQKSKSELKAGLLQCKTAADYGMAVAAAAHVVAPAPAVVADDNEREGLGPRQAQILEEQRAEAQRRQEQQRVQELRRRARAQRAARRSTCVPDARVRPPQQSELVPPQMIPARLSVAAQLAQPQSLLYVPAVAMISPMPIVTPPPPVLTSIEAPVSMLTKMPMPAPMPPVSPTAADPMPSPAVSVPTVPTEKQLPPPTLVAQEPCTKAAGPSEQAPLAQGSKRSNQGAIGQTLAASAVENDRAVRPRRERRVPKHLLDAEMELAQEMQQVMGAATAAVAAAAVAAPVLSSSPLPASPAANSPVTAANAAIPKPRGPPMPPPAMLASSIRQDKDSQLQHMVLRQQLSGIAGGGEADSPAAPGLQHEPVVGDMTVATVLSTADAAGRRADLHLLQVTTRLAQVSSIEQQCSHHPPLRPSPSPPPPQQQQQWKLHEPVQLHSQQQQQQQQQQQVEHEQPVLSQPMLPQLQQQQQQHSQQAPEPQAPSLLQQHAQHERVQEVQHINHQQQQPALHQLPSSQPYLEARPVMQQDFEFHPQVTATETESRSAAVPPAALRSIQADEASISPRRSSRPTRPSVRLLSVSGSGGGSGQLAQAAEPVAASATAAASILTTVAATAAPTSVAVPAVLLLRRETTSGPSTSMRGGHTATRRTPMSLGAALPGGLPRTSALNTGATEAGTGLPAALVPQRAVVLGPSKPLNGLAATKAANIKTSSASRCNDASLAVCSNGDEERSLPLDHVAEDISKVASTIPICAAQQPLLSGQKGLAMPPLALPAEDKTENPPEPQKPRVLSMGAGDSLHSHFGAVPPSLKGLLQPRKLGPSLIPAAPLAPSQPPPEPSGTSATQQQPEQPPAAPLPSPSLLSASPQNPVAHSAAGRPVRKRKTTLSNDMIIYGESAALFGQSPFKRKSSGDRRVATTTTSASGSGSGSGAAASAGVGTGSSAADTRQVVGGNEFAVAELEDTHDSLASFAVDELRPIVMSMSPPHPLFNELRREPTPLSLPMALPMPLTASINLHHGLTAHADTCSGDGAVGMVAVGPASVDDTSKAIIGADMDTEEGAGAVAFHSLPGFLALHDDEPGQEHDQEDMFLAEAAGRTLALSASPSGNGLESLAAMMLLPPHCGGSPRMAATEYMLMHAAGAEIEPLDAGRSTSSAIAVASAADAVLPSQQLQLLADIVMSSRVVASGDDTTCPGMGTPLNVLSFSLPVERTGGCSFSWRNDTVDQQARSLTRQDFGASVFNTAVTCDSVSNLLFTDLEDPSQGALGGACGYDAPASVAAYFDGSRQGLNGLAASAAGEWADLDDIVVL